MFLSLFVLFFLGLILADLIKGLSANGTPPVLQKLPGQIHLAHFMWSNIRFLRIIFLVALLTVFVLSPNGGRWIMTAVALPLGLVWYGVYWLFTHFWTGRKKFPGLSEKVFLAAEDNQVDLDLEVIGLDHGGEQKAFPVNMVTFHHQIVDSIGGMPVWVTYCGLCRSGRVYDLNVDGMTLDFTLVGAISFNATFEDNQTGTWWRQETGEAAKGKLKGRVLEDVGFEQMTLGNWLQKHPDSQVLQYDPKFIRPYTFVAKLHNFEATKPAWHMQETPAMVLGLELAGAAKAYDLDQLKARGVVDDEVGGAPIVVVTDAAKTSAFVYSRDCEGQILDFSVSESGMVDAQTGSQWDWFGACLDGEMKGKKLNQLQSYQQYVRSWIEFHPNTEFFDFN